MQKRFSPVLLLADIALLVGSVYLGRTHVRLQSSGLRAPGIVRALEVPNSGSRSTAYYPVVEFTAEKGERVRFRDGSGSNPPSFHLGKSVTVLYLKGDAHSAMIDRGAMDWLAPVAVLLFGGLLTSAGIRAVRNRSSDG